jgi:hypothetical protein
MLYASSRLKVFHYFCLCLCKKSCICAAMYHYHVWGNAYLAPFRYHAQLYGRRKCRPCAAFWALHPLKARENEYMYMRCGEGLVSVRMYRLQILLRQILVWGAFIKGCVAQYHTLKRRHRSCLFVRDIYQGKHAVKLNRLCWRAWEETTKINMQI